MDNCTEKTHKKRRRDSTIDVDDRVSQSETVPSAFFMDSSEYDAELESMPSIHSLKAYDWQSLSTTNLSLGHIEQVKRRFVNNQSRGCGERTEYLAKLIAKNAIARIILSTERLLTDNIFVTSSDAMEGYHRLTHGFFDKRSESNVIYALKEYTPLSSDWLDETTLDIDVKKAFSMSITFLEENGYTVELFEDRGILVTNTWC